MTPATALHRAQLATAAALASRHPGSATLTPAGSGTGSEIRGGIFRGALEWLDDDGVPRRDQGVSLIALKSRFPADFDEHAKNWAITYGGQRWRLLSVTPWGASWLVRGVR